MCLRLTITIMHTHTHVHTPTHTHSFNGHFPSKPGLAVPIILILSILIGQAKTLHIRLDTIPPSLPWMSLLPGSLKFHLQHHSSHSASFLRSTCPNHRNLPLLIVKLTRSSPNSPLISIFLVVLQIKTTHPSKHTHLIPVQRCFMLYLHDTNALVHM